MNIEFEYYVTMPLEHCMHIKHHKSVMQLMFIN